MKLKTKSNKKDKENMNQRLINSLIFTVFGILLFAFWINSNRKIDFDDLTKINGDLIDYEYRRPADRGIGYEGKELFFKVKGYDCEFSISTDYERFKQSLNDTSNSIVTYIEPFDKIKLDKGIERIHILGLQVNSIVISKIEDSIQSRNFMMIYGIMILGVASCIIGFFDFIKYLEMKKNIK